MTILIIRALAIGGFGGVIAHLMHLPLAWMIGPMIANICASMGGIRVAIPTQMRASMLILLGCFLGSSFSPIMLEQLGLWPFSLASVLVFVIIITFLSAFYFHKIIGFDFITALFSATPGGLTPMTILGGALGGQEPYIAFTQGLRVVCIVCLTPLLIFGILGESQQTNSVDIAGAPFDLVENMFLLLAAGLGVFLATKLRIPAAQMTGAMFVSAGLYLSGTVTAGLPPLLLEVTLWILGSAIGSRFSGFNLAIIRQLSFGTLINIAFLMALTALLAAILSHWTGLPYIALLLSLAPGGVAEMCLIALALNIDPGFVALHHLARISLILLATPVLGRFIRSRAAKADPDKEKKPGRM